MFGLAVGSGFVGPILAKGRRKVIIAICLLGILGCGMSMVPNTYVVIAGRFIYGFSSGILIVAGSTVVHEIIPKHLLDKGYAQSTNLFICFGILISLALGLGAPT